MKKKTAGLLITGTATLIGGVAIALLNSKSTQEDKIKDLVTEVWNDIKTEAIDTLNLKKEPKLEWDSEGDYVMCVPYTAYTQGWFLKVITKTDTKYIIKVNMKALINTIKVYQRTALYPCKDLKKMLISQLFFHECRHIWQSQEGFYVGKEANGFNNLLKGHGELAEEKDANEFAYSMAKTDKEKALSLLHKKQQEQSGKIVSDGCREEAITFIKEFNPILRWIIR